MISLMIRAEQSTSWFW